MILQMTTARKQNYIGLLIFAALAMVVMGVGSFMKAGVIERQADASVLVQKDLYFRDLPDGSVGVISANNGDVVAKVEGQAGFVRGILRAMARERRIRHITSDDAFSLISHSDGRLTLVDPATQNRIDLESFGKDNAAEFAAFLNSSR
ncbi:photosynthetic complex assembly protein PuhC [Polynucleobacter paneuropaeus]|jgi:putative photosynthetic complex assembly protein|uniref:Photosynthetic complex assembly protein PuhC n=2 Tax=Polynucleobacter paneuropaeus TaxID=2527775 RepID=A0ABX9FDZ1_9BURK|nr:photosynthetic complex assembly protein PuhC [Polynucleobacter paneuropaeus]AWW48384.1 photosynthetic complex assembly protein PuhC [Polynucleobacter paneuropaeus]MBT8535922.1 photosynthetic complex assembly protein PuhC [Polynucleobacter paneuropaeus]MBT8582175.1 photosynthetic complex assembly protein PuhC [Polynucleobacter paneuropaeus]MBT8588229.1 photosynthetic complex assembly protein PuhC [Polynucleobacter paneuropaeus]MBT8592886.1 photosynthetic complex assembly protein PuhC [Polynu